MEEDMEITITPETFKMMKASSNKDHGSSSSSSKKHNRQQGLKSLVKSCVRGKLRTKD